KLTTFSAFVVGEENKPVVVQSLQQYNTSRWPTLLINRSEVHRIGFVDLSIQRFFKPLRELGDRMPLDIFNIQCCLFVILSQRGEVLHGSVLAQKCFGQRPFGTKFIKEI